jgi:superfamily II DNA/RNA helicase
LLPTFERIRVLKESPELLNKMPFGFSVMPFAIVLAPTRELAMQIEVRVNVQQLPAASLMD